MSEFRVLDLPSHADARGVLVAMERALPFEVRRVFWISGADGQVRGGHRHHVNRLALVAVTGRVDIFMNDGRKREVVVLDRPSRCLLVEPDDWHTMTFGPGSSLLVFASEPYDVADYIDEEYPD